MSSVSSISPAVSFQMHPFGRTRNQAPPSHPEAELTSSEKKQVEKLKERDAEVRRHEQAHLAAAGPYGKGPPKFEYREGPDGKQYAVGGHVEIDTSEIRGDPQTTLKKAQILRRAALAPNEPSEQDQKIAREAEQMAQKADRKLQEQKAEAENAAGQHPSDVTAVPEMEGMQVFQPTSGRESSGSTPSAIQNERQSSGATHITSSYDRRGSLVSGLSSSSLIDVVV